MMSRLPSDSLDSIHVHRSPFEGIDRAQASLQQLLGSLQADGLGAHEPSATGERILDAAIEIFAARGFASTTVRELATAVGIKAPGLYAHFASKEDILARAMLRALTGFLTYMTAPSRPGTPVEMLEQTVRRHVRYQLDHLQATRANDLLLASESLREFLPPADHQRVQEVRRAYYRLVRCRIDAALPRGSVVDPDVAAFALIHLCNLVTSWFQPDGAMGVEDVADHYWFLAVGMLRLEEASAS